jgi:membrane fusion protein (multidrug efflux system)
MMRRCALAGVIALAGGCGKDSGSRKSAPATQNVEVGTVELRPKRVELATELPGRTAAYRVAQVHARVDGIVQKRLYDEGADVKEGQPLFQIDPAPYEAALIKAKAQVASAEADATAAKLIEERNESLIQSGAIAREEYDNSVARAKAAIAAIEGAKAQVKSADIDLGYAHVASPIDGKTSRSDVTEGAYVRASEATLLTTVTQLDPIYVDTAIPAIDLLRIQRATASGALETTEGKPRVTVVLEDGRPYPEPGVLLVTGVNVDETTGSVAVRALVPNPKHQLLPGMYVRARLQEGVAPQALLVPQRAVTRDRTGEATALVVKQGKVEQRKLQIDRAVGDSWVVTAGVSAGDHVIVDGLQKAKPGMTVNEVPAPASLKGSAEPQEQEPPWVGVR